jgi:hypothetical protein
MAEEAAREIHPEEVPDIEKSLAEIESLIKGSFCTIILQRVVLPAPEGEEMMITNG